MASFVATIINFICRFRLPAPSTPISNTNVTKFDKILEPLVLDNKRITLEEVNELIKNSPYIDINQFFFKKFSGSSTIELELYPNFEFYPKYFYNTLNKDNLEIIISYNENLNMLLHTNHLKSSEYVNLFLRKLLHKQNLTILKLPSLNITEIPEAIYELTNLKVICLESNDLEDSKLFHKCLPNLEELQIAFNKNITKIDDWICNLPSLKVLLANRCSITRVSEDINKLKILEELILTSNQIKSFPSDLSNLNELKVLSIRECAFEELVLNMSETPKLNSILLGSNLSLKRLKLLMSKNIEIFKYFEISNCPVINIEVWLNPKDINISTSCSYDKQLENADYVINFNPSETIEPLISPNASKSKIFGYYLDSNLDSNKTISIRKFDPAIEKYLISQDDLITKWTRICRNSGFEYENLLQDEFKNRLIFIKSLYTIKNNIKSNNLNVIRITPEYKIRIISILDKLFDNLEEKDAKSKVENIFKAFKRPNYEKLVHFNLSITIQQFYFIRQKLFYRFY